MKKIVIVEDDELLANIYRNKLLGEGYLAEVALDGERGLELIVHWRPDLVLLDLMVPKLTGIELLEKIRRWPGFESLPVVVFTSSSLSSIIDKARQAGATKFLSKSICTPKQLLEIIRDLIFQQAPSPIGAETPASGPTAAADETRARADLRQRFVDSLPAKLNNLQIAFQLLGRTADQPAQLELLGKLLREVHELTGRSAATGMVQISQMSDALEALLKELCDKPKHITASSIRTVALAIDFLILLFTQGKFSEPKTSVELPQAKVLVVDDEVLSRRAISHALEKAGLQSVSLGDPAAALELLESKSFDLIFLDVDMPGMTGFDLCAKVRALPNHKRTPVVFVTGLTDFESRCNSTLSGGNDFIAKPFLFMELAVKALIHVLRAGLYSSN